MLKRIAEAISSVLDHRSGATTTDGHIEEGRKRIRATHRAALTEIAGTGLKTLAKDAERGLD